MFWPRELASVGRMGSHISIEDLDNIILDGHFSRMDLRKILDYMDRLEFDGNRLYEIRTRKGRSTC